MKILFDTTLTLFLTLGLIVGHGQAIIGQQRVKIRIKNESKFLITKLIILDKSFENIKSGDSTEYVEVESFYPSMKVDITIQRNRTFRHNLWYHKISYPIDHVGEKMIKNDKNTLVINILKGEQKGQKIKVETQLIKE